MILTITLHCSGRDPYDCTAAITTGYTQPEHGAWKGRLFGLAQESGWSARPVAHSTGSNIQEAFCPTCTERLLDLAAGITCTNPQLDTLRDILLLVNVAVPEGQMAAWTRAQRREAEEWASLEHLAASDNVGIRRRPKPAFLP